MTVLPVTRITPQGLAAFQVGTDNANISFALQNALMSIGSTASMRVVSGVKVTNLLQVTITQPTMADQHAWPGDWILVTDATYDAATNTWTVSHTTQVIVYGIGTGQTGSRADFLATFHADTPFDWTATPAVVAQSGAELTITFASPTSANGPWTWTYTLTDHTAGTSGSPVAFTPTTVDGNFVTTVTGLTVGHDYSVVVDCADGYSHTATSPASDTVTAIE